MVLTDQGQPLWEESLPSQQRLFARCDCEARRDPEAGLAGWGRLGAGSDRQEVGHQPCSPDGDQGWRRGQEAEVGASQTPYLTPSTNLLRKSNYIQEETHSFSELAEMKQLSIGFVPEGQDHCLSAQPPWWQWRGAWGPPRPAVALPPRGCWLRAHARLLGFRPP